MYAAQLTTHYLRNPLQYVLLASHCALLTTCGLPLIAYYALLTMPLATSHDPVFTQVLKLTTHALWITTDDWLILVYRLLATLCATLASKFGLLISMLGMILHATFYLPPPTNELRLASACGLLAPG